MDESTERRVGIGITSDPDKTSIKQPQTHEARPVTALPLRLLLVSDLIPLAAPDWSGPSRILRVDKNNFGDLMAQTAPRLEIEVPNRISDEPRVLDVALDLSSLKDFHPEKVAAQVPALNQLVEIRKLVAGVSDGAIELGTFRDRLEKIGVDAGWAQQLFSVLSAPEAAAATRSQAGESAGADGGDPLDRLFGMVDAGADSPDVEPPEERPRAGLMDTLMDAVGEPSESRSKVEKDAAGTLVQNLDDVIEDQVNAILNHPAFRRVEAAWRGLKFLVDRIDYRKNIQLDVLPAGKKDLSEALYHQVLIPEHDEKQETVPLTAILLDHSFDNNRADAALLEDLGETGASLQVPVIAGAEPAFFGIAEASGLSRLPLLHQHLAGPEYIAWNKLRSQDEARSLALVPIPFLLRNAYGESDPVESFAFEETGQLWGNGALLVGAVIALSFSQTGWPTHLLRNGSSGIGSLPVWKAGDAMIPLAAALSTDKKAELAAAGFVVPGCKVNDDRVTIEHAPTVFQPSTYEDPEVSAEMTLHASLASQLFMARAAQFILKLRTRIDGSQPVDKMQHDIEDAVHTFLGTSLGDSDAVSIQHMEDPEASQNVFVLRLQPPSGILEGGVGVAMVLDIPNRK